LAENVPEPQVSKEQTCAIPETYFLISVPLHMPGEQPPHQGGDPHRPWKACRLLPPDYEMMKKTKGI